HMIYEDHACQIVCWNDGYMYLHAIRSPKIECVVIQHPWMENDCLAADIVLPALTMAEGEDFDICGKQMPAIAHYKQAIKPIGEAKSDYEIGAEIAKKLEKLGGVYAGAYAKYTDGKTTEEWIKSGFDKSGAQTYISLEKLKEKGYFPAETRPDWQQQPYGVRKFYEDPVKNPLPVPTGKIELYSARLAENFPDDKERPPYPQYVIGGPASEGWFHDESLWGERAKKYPLLLVSNHPRWRVHAQYDDVPWFREIPTCKVKGPDGYLYEPVWIHPKTAAERGIRTGDIVKIFNDRGITLGGAQVSERIMPGHIYQDHGARLDPISWEDSEYDDRATKWINRGADNNVISPAMGVSKNCWGMATSGFLVDCQKLSGNEYEEWRQKYPEAFARDYDPAYGLKFDAWIEGGT
ncbi:MAG: dehydrogenase, partial [Chloroflexi bacterium]|nr:dehydrogenase [Chloroflexota bacterium]